MHNGFTGFGSGVGATTAKVLFDVRAPSSASAAQGVTFTATQIHRELSPRQDYHHRLQTIHVDGFDKRTACIDRATVLGALPTSSDGYLADDRLCSRVKQCIVAKTCPKSFERATKLLGAVLHINLDRCPAIASV
jgi:hypothetical protein